MNSKETMIHLVQGQLEAYNKRDLEKFCQYYHPQIKCTKLILEKTLDDNISSFKEAYKILFEQSPNLHCEIKSRIILDECIIDEELVTGISKYPNGHHAVAVYSFKDNLIYRVWFI